MKKLTRITESDFLQFYDDLIQKKAGAVSPDMLAPTEQEQSEGGYDEAQDPELNESLHERLKHPQALTLRESITSELTDFITNSEDDLSWGAFQEMFPTSKTTQDSFVKNIIGFTKKVAPEKLGMIEGAKRNRSDAYTAAGEDVKGSKAAGPYARDENFKASPEQEAAMKKYGEAQPASSRVGNLFEDVEMAIESVIENAGVQNEDAGDEVKHLCICGDPGIGKTYTVLERFAPDHKVEQRNGKTVSGSTTGAKLFYTSGAIGAQMVNVVPFFYLHKDNEVIILDDNDAMIGASLPQDTMNMMKAILDPSSAYKPITVKQNQRKSFQQALEGMQDGAAPTSGMDEGIQISIDRPALRENQLHISVGGKTVVNHKISTYEANQWLAKTKPVIIKELREDYIHINPNKPYLSTLDRLYEAEDDVWDEDSELIDDNVETKQKKNKKAKKNGNDGTEETNEDGEPTFPATFYFNSSVIFLSNYEIKQINKAVKDRCQVIEIKLTLPEFMDRLTTCLSGVYKGHGEIGDWAKKNVYTALGIAVAAFNTGKPLNGQPVQIGSKLTFRLVSAQCQRWIAFTKYMTKKTGLDYTKPASRAKLAQEMLPEFLSRYLLPTIALKED